MRPIVRQMLLIAAFLPAGCSTATLPSSSPAALPLSAQPAGFIVTAHDEAGARGARILSHHFMRLRKRGGDAAQEQVRTKYPADLVRKKGPIMKSAASFNIYVNCKAGGESCWGDPEGFQKALTGSTFAGLLQQYTKTPPTSYTFGGAFSVKYHTYTKLFYANDLLAVVHAAIEKNGGQAGSCAGRE